MKGREYGMDTLQTLIRADIQQSISDQKIC